MVNNVTGIQLKKTEKNVFKEKALEPYREVAQGLEAQFLNHLLGEMRKTINKNDPDSSEMDYYRSLLDNEYAQLMTKQNEGVGIQQIILDQILPHHLKNRKPNKNVSMSAYESSKGIDQLQPSTHPRVHDAVKE